MNPSIFKKTVLVIEDEEFISNLMAHVLRKEGYNVLVAGDYKSSIKIIDTSPLDMIISDVMLPFTGGLEILEYVKGNDKQKHIPFILVTGMDKDILYSSDIKAEAILTKPFDVTELLSVVKSNLEEKGGNLKSN
jgi:DNA-binding response OmpR family regulator